MIKLLKYDLNSTYELNKESLNKLDNYVALTDDNQMVHLKNVNKDISYILKYKASNNPLFENIALFLTRADLYKSVKIDNQEISLSDKERIPYVCQSYNSENSDETMAEILYNTLLDSDTSQIKPKYNIYENYTEDKEGVIEVVFQENLTPQNIYGIFLSNVSLTSIPKDMLSVLSKDCTNMNSMFYDCRGLTSLDLSKFDTSNVTNMSNMFSDCSSLTSLDLSKFDTSNVTNMSNMFSDCSSLTSLDLSNFNTSKVTDMNYMFSYCYVLTSLDLTSFDTSKVSNMNSMFTSCTSLTSLDLTSFDTSNVTTMFRMFSGCTSLTSLDLSKFDTSKVTNMSNMFSDCSSLTSLDLSNFDTSKVTDTINMFRECSGLTSLDLSNFNTSKVTSMNNMFSRCEGLTSLDLSNFDTTNVTTMSYMFNNCIKLTHIKCKQSFKDWCWTNQNAIHLPTAMRDGGGGTWDIVDVQS